MIIKLKINDFDLYVENCIYETFINELTGNELKRIYFEVILTNEEKKEQFNEIITNSSFIINIEFNGTQKPKFITNMENMHNKLEFKGKLDPNAKVLCENIENTNNKYKYTLQIVEIDKDIPEDWHFMIGVCEGKIMNRMLIRSLVELLVDKGLFTKEEFNNKVDSVKERDYENLKKYLFHGIEEKR